jgi:DNA-binding transcriptional LysR family regulator
MHDDPRMLRDGRVDLAFLHAPHDDLSGFDTELLLTQDQVAMLPRCHRMADRAALEPADLDGEPTPRRPGPSPEQASDPDVRDNGQLMQLVALSRVVAVLPESARATRGRMWCVCRCSMRRGARSCWRGPGGRGCGRWQRSSGQALRLRPAAECR